MTTSEADWHEWATRNVQITDGGVALAETTEVRSRTIGESIVDVTVDRTGILYVLTTDGEVYQYDVAADTRELLTDGTSRDGLRPRSITTGGSRVFITGEGGETAAIVPETRRETEPVETLADDPVASIYDRETLYMIDASETLVSIRGDEQDTNKPPGSMIDVATVSDGLVVLTATEGGYRIWKDQSGRDETDRDGSLSPETPVDGDSRFTPTAIAGAGDTIVLAGHVEDRDEYALFEYESGTEQLSHLTTLENEARVEALAGTESEDGTRSFYAVDEYDRCLALTERVEYLERAGRNTHAGLAVTRYDSGTEQLEWHRLTIDFTRFPANTRVRVRYCATDEPLLSLDAVASRPAATAEPGPTEAATDETVSDSADESTGQLTELRPASVREPLQASGVTTGLELARADPERIATRQAAPSLETVREWQRTAFDALEAHAESEWTVTEIDDSPDILLHAATGRYLYVALELVGTPTASPLVDTVTAYCPRQSYLRYMPELYQEDNGSAKFLERFLSIFETSFVDVQSEIGSISRYFDPHGVPSDSLEWLEEWLAADEYREWPESARREYLARAPELYKKRGTRAGLREVIELYLRHATDEQSRGTSSGTGDTATGHRLFFLEPGDIKRGTDDTGDGSYDSLVPTDRSVAVFCGPFESQTHEEAVETIVETETPAHVDATVYTMNHKFELGLAAFLGANTRLGTESFSLGEATLGRNTYLSGANEG
ncbi:MAG: phage tail protein [Natronomonas sp.]